MLPNDPQSVGRARSTARRVLSAAGVPEADVERAALVVSELVTNAVVHAHSEVCVRVIPEPVPRIEVEDNDPTLPDPEPSAPRSLDALEPGGLGLTIVDQLVDRWGAEPTAHGKVVWFELAPAGQK